MTERGRDACVALAVAATVIAVWGHVCTGPYQFDDYVTPLQDPASESLPAFLTHAATTLRPLTKLTYATEASLGVVDAWPRRLFSVFLLGGTSALMFGVLRSATPRLAWPVCAGLAVLFGFHPVHAEAVLAVAGRPAILSALFVLAAVIAAHRGSPRSAALLLLAATLARETAIAAALPVALALEASGPALLAERWARTWAVAAVPGIVVATITWMSLTPRYRFLADFSFGARDWRSSTLAQIAAVPEGLRLLVQPSLLSIDHGTPLPTSPFSVGFCAGISLYAAAIALIFAARSRWPAVALAAGLWLAALVPTQSVIPKVDALTERPLLLAWAAIVVGIGALVEALAAREPKWTPAATVAALAACAYLAVATTHRGALYADPIALWTDAAGKSLTNARPHANVAVLLLEAGRPAEARAEAVRALAIDRLHPTAQAILYQTRGLDDQP